MTSRPEVQLWTDGSTYPSNPGHGGWAAILVKDDHYRAMSGYVPHATNNKTETAGVLAGLLALTVPCIVRLYTDSMYVIRGLRALRYNRLLETNVELWQQLEPLYQKHTIIWEHVSGHSGVAMNEWANDLAGEAAWSKAGIDEYVEGIPQAIEKKSARKRARREKQAKKLSE